MIGFVLIAALALAQGVSVQASLDLLLRGNEVLSSDLQHAGVAPAAASTGLREEFPNKKRDVDSVLDDVNDIDDDVPENGGQALLTRIRHYHVGTNGNRRVKSAINNIILELLSQLAKNESGRQNRQQGRQIMGKRLWGQRRNGPSRIASFGTKLSPSRKMLLGGSGSTLLRYGRSTHEK